MAGEQVQDANSALVDKVAPLGEAGSQTSTVLANAETKLVSPDTKEADAAAAVTTAEAAVAAAKTPEEKAAAQAELDKIKLPVPVVDPAALAAAEKAVADAKTPEEKAAAEKALDALKKPAEDKPGTAPEKYTDFVVPDGVIMRPEDAASFGALAKELSLSQSQAQKLVDYEAGRIKAAGETAMTAYNQLLTDRLAVSKADPEVGGIKFDESVADARKAMAAFGTPALQKYFDASDAGSHVEIIRMLAKIGKAVSDDKIHLGGKPIETSGPKSLEERLFPSAKPA